MIVLPRLSLLGRTVALLGAELIFNVTMWIVASLLFRKPEARGVLSLCLLAWTLGLRHALDADHISAIDNATRGLMSLGQLSVLCGLFFSLGHSTIVIVVNVAIAISTGVYDKIGHIGTVGGIVGPAVSASFLFLIGTANSIFLYRIVKQRREDRKRESQGLGLTPSRDGARSTPSIMLRLLGPVTKFVDRPWKMYPVGVLFGFGFDTASSIALLAVTALAKKDSNGKESINQADIIILPLLFTAGMTLVDSIDSIIMLYSYSGFPERGWSLLQEKDASIRNDAGSATSPVDELTTTSEVVPSPPEDISTRKSAAPDDAEVQNLPILDAGSPSSASLPFETARIRQSMENKQHTMSNLSIILTLVSILVAFSISLLTLMGLIGDNCKPCHDAAENDPGLAGRWWRAWANGNDNSGLIGAIVVGVFVGIVISYYAGKWVLSRWRSRLRSQEASPLVSEVTQP